MKVVDISEEIYRELGKPENLSVPPIAYWVRTNIGALNNYIHKSFYINSTTLEIEEIVNDKVVEIGENEKAILKKMYMVHYYELKLKTHILTLSTDTIISVEDDGSSVTKVNKNEISKTFSQIKSQEFEELQNMISAYKIGRVKPLQVAGDDAIAGPGINLYGSNLNRLTFYP
jgi:hypothetical protein